MKKLILLKLILILLTLTFQGQVIQNYVIGTAGNIDTIGKFQVGWTVGEPVVEKLVNTDCIATQGFHQTYFTISNISQFSEVQFKVVCYPNPTVKDVHIKIESDKPNERFSITIMDMNGKQLFKKETFIGKVETIDLSGFSSSLLLLKVIQLSEKKVQTFKIIKQNHF